MNKSAHGDGKPILRRIALLLVIPLASLIGLWGFATAESFEEAVATRRYRTVSDRLTGPGGLLVAYLQQERSAAAAHLGTPGPGAETQLRAAVKRTDEAITGFQKAADSDTVRNASARLGELADLGHRFSGLERLRILALKKGTPPLPVIEGYNGFTDALFQGMSQMPGANDVEVQQRLQMVMNMIWSREVMLREDALIVSAPAKTMSAGHRAVFAQWSGRRIQLFEQAQRRLDEESGEIFDVFAGSPEFARYKRAEAEVVRSGVGGAGPTPAEWQAAVNAVSPLWDLSGNQISKITYRRVDVAGERVMRRLYLFGGLGFLAVVMSIVLFVRFARGISFELRSLQGAAQDLAQVRLPRVVSRLRRGESVDVTAEAPELPGGVTREIKLVAEAFADVQRTTVRVAVAEADLRGGINQVFINLSWRSLALLQRQLKLLDAMERRAASSEELDDLFKLDHLTTRMRRHAEGLVILSGAPTVRAWDHPVPAEDVARAALSEIEEYQRVDITGSAPVALASVAVADVIHLLAELIENAAVFSPPTNEVTVRLDVAANGFIVEIIDRGIGMPPDQLREANQRLIEAPDFDLADSDRLGLFVVARLAARHGISVRLQPSSYGGTTAVVLIPRELVLTEAQAQAQDRPGSAHREDRGDA